MSTMYISPTKCGTGDGSSWENSAGLSDLSSMIAQAGADGTVLLRADQGAYHTTGQISITHGGTDGHPVTILGVDGAGNPMRAEIIGTREAVVTATSAPGSEVFRLLDGADNLSFEHLSFVNQGNGCFRIGADIAHLTIQHVDADNVTRFIEDYASGTRTSASVDGLAVRDVDVTGFSRGVIRLAYDSHNIVLENITGDSERQNADNWATGVGLEGTVHDVTIRDVAMNNSFDDSTSYWNGDGFATEAQTHDIVFENTSASGNTDGGYDIKSDNVTMINASAEGNKRNFRFWGHNVTVSDSTSIDPHTQGGTGSQDHIFLADGAAVTIINSTIIDADPKTIGFDLGDNATLTLRDTAVSLSPDAEYAMTRTNSVLDVIVSGPDLIESTATFSLSGHAQHNLTLTGAADVGGTGNDLANVLTGNTGNNALQGGAGNDTVIGGSGNDRLHGGAGSDTASYAGSSAAVTVSLASTAAQDTGAAGVDTLVGIESLAGGAHNDVLTGNGGANSLSGGDGSDTLDGKAGADSMAGGAGNDTYVIDSATDKIGETGSDAGDTVQATIAIDLSLAAFAGIENVTLTGTGAINATGSGGANHLVGNDGANVLDGRGGADSLEGGKGNDTYLVDNGGDSVIEIAGGGIDTVKSTVAYTLADPFVNNLTLTGTAAIHGTGNALHNVITGNAAANALEGGAGNDTLIGGAGNDTLVGGSGNDRIDVSIGNDTVRYTSALDGTDVINGFDGNASGGQDTLNLDALFDSLGIAAAGRAAHLSVNTHATSVDVRFDADGNGSFESIVATLNTTDAITVGADIVVGT